MNRKKEKTNYKTRLGLKVLYLSVPGLAGFILFYLFPFFKSIWYSFINDTYNKKFVFFDNYINVLTNKYYQLALKNTIIFSVVGIVLLMAISLILSFLLFKLGKRLSFIKNAFVMPMILPTASVILFWQMCFGNDAYFNMMKESEINWFFQVLPIYLLFIWKNAGINIILITSALSQIPREFTEAAQLDGAGGFKLHRKITLPLIEPTVFFTFVLSFVNSLKVFKESYLFYGTNYPPDAAYTVQFYMNNHFTKLNYHNLTSGVIMFTIVITAVIFFTYRVNNRFMRDIY